MIVIAAQPGIGFPGVRGAAAARVACYARGLHAAGRGRYSVRDQRASPPEEAFNTAVRGVSDEFPLSIPAHHDRSTGCTPPLAPHPWLVGAAPNPPSCAPHASRPSSSTGLLARCCRHALRRSQCGAFSRSLHAAPRPPESCCGGCACGFTTVSFRWFDGDRHSITCADTRWRRSDGPRDSSARHGRHG